MHWPAELLLWKDSAASWRCWFLASSVLELEVECRTQPPALSLALQIINTVVKSASIRPSLLPITTAQHYVFSNLRQRWTRLTTRAPPHSIFYRPDALPDANSTVTKHWRQNFRQHSCIYIHSHYNKTGKTKWTTHITAVSGRIFQKLRFMTASPSWFFFRSWRYINRLGGLV